MEVLFHHPDPHHITTISTAETKQTILTQFKIKSALWFIQTFIPTFVTNYRSILAY